MSVILQVLNYSEAQVTSANKHYANLQGRKPTPAVQEVFLMNGLRCIEYLPFTEYLTNDEIRSIGSHLCRKYRIASVKIRMNDTVFKRGIIKRYPTS